MKRVILSAVMFFGIASFASAQSSGSSGTGSGSSGSAPKQTNRKKPSEKLNNRKIYHFRSGQRSTPTGAEATPSSSGGYAALGKDTTPTVVSQAPRTAVTKKTSARKRKQ